jgi:HSP20 family protein
MSGRLEPGEEEIMTTKEMTTRENNQLDVRSKEHPSREEQNRQVIAPLCDVLENQDEYLLKADLPGVRSDDVHVELHNGELTLRAPRNGAGFDLFSGEKTEYEYVRRFRVPGGISGDNIRAELKAGVLNLHIPKEETKKPRQIPVNAA